MRLQVEGGFVQGIGLYTIEELQFSPEGVLLTRGPSRYKIPALCDIPPQLNVHLLRNADNPHAIYSSKVRQKNPEYQHNKFKQNQSCLSKNIYQITSNIYLSVIIADITITKFASRLL